MKTLKHKVLMPLAAGLIALSGIGSASAAGGMKIGVIVPLTGTNAVQGQDIQRGIQLAVARINAGYDVPLKDGKSEKVGPGLVDGNIELIIQDTESRPQSAMDSVRKLVNVDHVPVVLGVLSSGIAVPTGQFTNNAQTIQIVAAATTPKLRDIGPYFFSSLGLDTLMGKAIGEFAKEDSGASRFGSLVANNPFGVGMEITACKHIDSMGGDCVAKVRYHQGKSDYRPEISAVFRPQPEAVLFTAYGTDARLLLRQAYQMGKKPEKGWYADYMTLWSNEVSDTPQIAEGIKGLIPGKPTGFYENEYVKPFQKKFGSAPKTTFSAYAYDSAMLAALAVKKAGTTDPDAVRKALLEVSKAYEGVTGDKTFDSDGMQKAEQYTQKIYHDGKLVDYPMDKS